MKKVFLYLEDGQSFQASSFGHETNSPYISEIVFNTSMQGYQEVFSDPSYCDQSVVMTYPLIGNYGINQDDSESIIPYLKTVIIRENCETPSNFRNVPLHPRKLRKLCLDCVEFHHYCVFSLLNESTRV